MKNFSSQHKKVFLFIISIIILFSAGFFAFKIFYDNTDDIPVVKTVYWGNQGQVVVDIQTKLKNWGYYKGSIDGIFGTETYNAVVYFQKKNGLEVDGVVGPKTFAALGLTKYIDYGSSSSAAANNSNLVLLARAIYAEAEGEPYIGQVAVGAVLLNRVASSSFPNTLSGVVYQSYALESIDTGRFSGYNNTCLKAAQDALNGWDPTYGCLYFWNPAKVAASSWIWTRQVVVIYGNHNFGK